MKVIHAYTHGVATVKLIVTVVDESDVSEVMTTLTDQHISLTHISSTGGLLNPGKATLLIGVEERLVPQVMKVIAELAGPRPSFIPYMLEGEPSLAGMTGVEVGGYLSFVLKVDHFEQV